MFSPFPKAAPPYKRVFPSPPYLISQVLLHTHINLLPSDLCLLTSPSPHLTFLSTSKPSLLPQAPPPYILEIHVSYTQTHSRLRQHLLTLSGIQIISTFDRPPLHLISPTCSRLLLYHEKLNIQRQTKPLHLLYSHEIITSPVYFIFIFQKGFVKIYTSF